MDSLKLFQEEMKKNNYTAYIIPTSDDHNSEYVSEYYKGRKYLSDFTGSAGTLVILQNNAFLWVDGRYYIQAEKQIVNKNIILMKIGQPNVPTITQFLATNLKPNDILAFDGKVMNTKLVLDIKNALLPSIEIVYDKDLLNNIWTDRPRLPFSICYILDTFFSGKSYKEKLDEIVKIMKKENADYYLLSALEDQAWLYNLRANDIECTPVFLSFTIITLEHTYLFIDSNKIDLNVEKYLNENDIIVKSYNDIYEFCENIKDKKIMMDYNKVNYYLYSILSKNNVIKNLTDPTLLLKAIKNETEINNIKLAHIKDGIAMTKFMYYIKEGHKAGLQMSEISLSNYLEGLRKKNKGFVELSFNTICAYQEHAAMMHYSATEETNSLIKDNGLLLVDSGGHYLEGSTDITRTYVLGKATEEEKIHYTTVLKSVIALSKAVFLKGCNGQNLDILARGPIWKQLIDYKCGTGHGVGYLLGVHEAPNGFRWQIVPERNDSHPFEVGMVTTNEPGIYLEGKYGIRIENEMLCVPVGSSEFGTFLGFETLTYAPIDLDGIIVKRLTKEEKDWLNDYHKMVYDKIHSYLTPEEDEWLKEYTKAI